MLDAQQACPGAPFTFAQDAKAATLKTAQLEVIVNIERGNLSFRTISGESLLNEGNSIPRTYEPVELNGEHTYRVTDRFSPPINEAVYGLGQHQSGMFNYRGATVELGQNNTDVAIPLLISNKGYGLMWNTAALTYFDNRFPLDMKLTSIAGKSIDYYFLYGPEIDAVLHEYRTMTGHAPMLPKWAYGFFQSKDRYVSLDEIREIAERYRQGTYPARRHGAGLVLVEDRRRSGLQFQLSRRRTGSRGPAQRKRARHDFCLGPARSQLRNLQDSRRKA